MKLIFNEKPEDELRVFAYLTTPPSPSDPTDVHGPVVQVMAVRDGHAVVLLTIEERTGRVIFNKKDAVKELGLYPVIEL
jgi:hypothetical protein